MKAFSPLIRNPGTSFDEAAGRVLQFLRRRYDLDLWMVTRVNRDDWVVLLADDRRGELVSGQVLSWSESICKRRVEGSCPGVIPAVADDPVARQVPIVDQLGIGAYIGAPLRSADGDVLGSLCGLHRAACPDLGDSDHELVALLAELLAGFMTAYIGAIDQERQNERFRFEAMTDAVTHLSNGQAWEQKLQHEQARALRLGETSFVAVVDLEALDHVNQAQGRAAGDELLRQTALALRYAVRDSDFIARLGGREFAVLGIQSGNVEQDEVAQRIKAALQRRDIQASVGVAAGGPASRHGDLWQHAVASLERRKRRRADPVR